jgi:hypothetical protein
MFLCIVFYATSKVFIYLFLGELFVRRLAWLILCTAEKVHIVWSNGKPRMRSPMYLVCVFAVSLYAVVAVVMILGIYWIPRRLSRCAVLISFPVGRIAEFRAGDGACQFVFQLEIYDR